jgi:hypothetical protein
MLHAKLLTNGGVRLRRIAAARVSVAFVLFGVRAWADEASSHSVDAGLGLTGLHAFHVAGGTGAYVARNQGFTFGLQPFGEWRVSDVVVVGLGVPVTLNAPGSTSNAYDIGFAPRLRVGYPTRKWLYPFLLVGAGPAWSRQHVQAWIFGVHALVRAGARLSLSNSLAAFAEGAYDYTSFSGDFPLYYATTGAPAPIQHGNVVTSYLGAGVGFEFSF